MNNEHKNKFIFDIETEFNDDAIKFTYKDFWKASSYESLLNKYEKYQKQKLDYEKQILRIKKLKRILDE